VAETDRRAVLGVVALERGDAVRAVDHLGWAAANGGRPEDHLAHIDALLRAGHPTRARGAAEALRAAHPSYALGDLVLAPLPGARRGGARGRAGPPAPGPARGRGGGPRPAGAGGERAGAPARAHAGGGGGGGAAPRRGRRPPPQPPRPPPRGGALGRRGGRRR